MEPKVIVITAAPGAGGLVQTAEEVAAAIAARDDQDVAAFEAQMAARTP